MDKNRNNANALAEQEDLLQAISEDSVIVEIRSSSALGAILLAFNQIARKYGKPEKSAQEWADDELPNALEARERAWKYSENTRNNAAYVEEMRNIKKLFTVPAPDHVNYMPRLMARIEAETACSAKYGIQ